MNFFSLLKSWTSHGMESDRLTFIDEDSTRGWGKVPKMRSFSLSDAIRQCSMNFNWNFFFRCSLPPPQLSPSCGLFDLLRHRRAESLLLSANISTEKSLHSDGWLEKSSRSFLNILASPIVKRWKLCLTKTTARRGGVRAQKNYKCDFHRVIIWNSCILLPLARFSRCYQLKIINE